MACYSPIRAYTSRQLNKNGNRYAVFDKKAGYVDRPINFSCGNCIGCKLEKSRQWAVRCMHESQFHEDNAFITLTYNDENLPADGSLNHRHYQLFMKKLRKKIPRTIKFFMCGEYGDELKRPHYHAILFNHDFADKQLYKVENGNNIYQSETLAQTWSHGFCTTAAVTFESAAYVARYVTKKITGDLADKTLHYWNIDYDTGEAVPRKPEYAAMSRGGRQGKGIAHNWYQKYGVETFSSDSVVINGREQKPPKYYTDQLKAENPALHHELKRKRLRHAQSNQADNTPRRLRDRETVRKAAISHLNRTYEENQ